MLVKMCHLQEMTVVKQMHVRIIEPGTDEMTLQVNHFINHLRKNLFIAADSTEKTAFGNEGLRKSLSGINLSVIISRFHVNIIKQ